MKDKKSMLWVCRHCKEEYPYEPVFCNDCGIQVIVGFTFDIIKPFIGITPITEMVDKTIHPEKYKSE